MVTKPIKTQSYIAPLYVQVIAILTQFNKYLLSISMCPSLIILHFSLLDMFLRVVIIYYASCLLWAQEMLVK